MLIRQIEELGAILRKRRQTLHLTQADVATKANVSRRSIIRIEAGEPRCEIGMVFKVAQHLGLDFSVFESDTRGGELIDRLLGDLSGPSRG
jgi:y4mF family transcriptional regulator